MLDNIVRYGIVWATSVVIITGVLFNGLSRWTEQLAPDIALTFNPLNAEAGINALVLALNSGVEPASSPEMQHQALRGLSANPIDARFLSVLAELRKREGDEASAQRLFRQAHQISRTEIHALQYLIEDAIVSERYAEAIRLMDAMLRRWPRQADNLAGLWPPLLAREEAYGDIMDMMREGTPWRQRVLSDLARQPDGAGLAYGLLLDLVDSANPPASMEIAAVTHGFLAAGRYEEAYRLFRFTLSPKAGLVTGFVHNGSFVPLPGGNPFTWDVRNSQVVDIRFAADGPFAGATVRFLNGPAKGIVFRQSLLLPAGRYRLVAEASASSLRAPRSLYWQIACLDQPGEITRLLVPEGTYRDKRLETEFVVNDCALQRISLATDVIAESSQNRYSGQVRFHSLSIERDDLGTLRN